MSKVCQVTNKKPLYGNNVSHSKRRTRRRFEPNLHVHRIWSEEQKKFITLRISNAALRLIDKKGLAAVLKETQVN